MSRFVTKNVENLKLKNMSQKISERIFVLLGDLNELLFVSLLYIRNIRSNMKFCSSIKISFVTGFSRFHPLIFTPERTQMIHSNVINEQRKCQLTKDPNNVCCIGMAELIHCKPTNAKALMRKQMEVKIIDLTLVTSEI